MQYKLLRFYLLFIALILCLLSCGEKGLSKGEARNLIDNHIKDFYGFTVPEKVRFELFFPEKTAASHKRILTAIGTGIINATFIKGEWGLFAKGTIHKPVDGEVYSITLTDKGKSIPHLSTKDGQIGFLTGHREIDEIISIEKQKDDQYIVMFSYVFKTNDFYTSVLKELNRKPSGETAIKYRGKAIISYDRFLKKYVLKSYKWSLWDKEEWKGTSWIDSLKDSKIIVTDD
jgi:hypothetical protein